MAKKFKPEYINGYNHKDFRENIKFLEHIIGCIKGNKSQNIIDNTIHQLNGMIEEQKDKIQKQNSSLGSKD